MKKLLLLLMLAGASQVFAMDVDGVKRAIEADNLDEARHLLNVGLQADPNFAVGEFLEYAETAEIATMLVDDYHVDVNKKFQRFEIESLVTPLHVVKTKEVAKLLLDRGADVDAMCNSGRTPLHHPNDIGIMRVLLEAGADVNATTLSGITPIMTMTASNKIDHVKLLLSYGADPYRQTLGGDSAIRVAKKRGHSELIELFERRQKIHSLLGTDKSSNLIAILRNREIFGSFRNPYK